MTTRTTAPPRLTAHLIYLPPLRKYIQLYRLRYLSPPQTTDLTQPDLPVLSPSRITHHAITDRPRHSHPRAASLTTKFPYMYPLHRDPLAVACTERDNRIIIITEGPLCLHGPRAAAGRFNRVYTTTWFDPNLCARYLSEWLR